MMSEQNDTHPVLIKRLWRFGINLKRHKFKTWRLIDTYVRRSMNHLLNRHPGSDPYLSGDTYRRMCIHEISEHSTLPQLREGDAVFLSLYFIERLRNLLPHINQRFVLVTHHSDASVTEEHLDILNNQNVIKWYAQNAAVAHDKLIAIPIGLEDRWRANAGHTKHFDKLRSNNALQQTKIPRILWGFSEDTNPYERRRAREILAELDTTDHINELSHYYREHLNGYMFVASPPGNGPDCHRTWEALYLNVVPIVKRDPIYYQFTDLPILIIEDWEELSNLNESDLRSIYQQLMKRKSQNQIIWSDYWKNRIKGDIS